ncbi:hypothetical protein ABZS68_40805 [Streptomyces sp. NPDC005571]|uniref:hypothetical protein n=1 Tax=unclassified Streptomyces TaxID=2593676 RepID=UPI0033A41DF5
MHRGRAGAAGELVYVDIKKLGNIPDGGGWRTVGRAAGYRVPTPHDAQPSRRCSPAH